MEMEKENKRETVNRLKQDLLRWQGVTLPEVNTTERVGLGPVEEAFPNAVFPTFGVHEFISMSREDSAATSGFIGGLVSRLTVGDGVCLWISTSQLLFPPSIRAFGVVPDRVVFVDIAKERDVLWATEEALKCTGLTTVVAELQEMDFVQSRRLQLAVEKSQVTGLILRCNPRVIGSTACVARWRIRPLPSLLDDGLPGVGFPRWETELLKVRNGNPGCWQLEWSQGRFVPVLPAKQSREWSTQLKRIS
ncbi:ImuA family protein [Parapedobacter indicus]|uniref:Protein ImuA n=1 Tax=Parapedobacter indicus TaxID=1477437 RepID=A0A1I3JCY2_9SPHI|nr:Error-prone repair protein ImuA [Parapedobacter indicus]PPL02470.1 protein ImuA [Parapedobacter indicus]SFI58097.1 protein ImuA [Parapedobacter indicus]